MLRFWGRAPDPLEDQMPPIKRVKCQDGTSKPAKFPHTLAASIKRKTASSTRLAKSRAMGGMFGKPYHKNATQHTKEVSSSINNASPAPEDSPQSNTLFSMFGRLSLKRSSAQANDPMMFGGRGMSPTSQSNDEPQSFLKSARSRMSLRNRHEQGPAALARVFKKPSSRAFEGTTLRGTRGANLSMKDIDPLGSVRRDSGVGSVDGIRGRQGSNTTIVPQISPQGIPHSAPIDIPNINGIYHHSPESVERIVTKALEDDAADDSMMSVSPETGDGPIVFKRENRCYNNEHSDKSEGDQHTDRDTQPAFVFGRDAEAKFSGLNRPGCQRAATKSSREMQEQDYARCVSHTPSVDSIVPFPTQEILPYEGREVDIRCRRPLHVGDQRNFEKDGEHGCSSFDMSNIPRKRRAQLSSGESSICPSPLDEEIFRTTLQHLSPQKFKQMMQEHGHFEYLS